MYFTLYNLENILCNSKISYQLYNWKYIFTLHNLKIYYELYNLKCISNSKLHCNLEI